MQIGQEKGVKGVFPEKGNSSVQLVFSGYSSLEFIFLVCIATGNTKLS